MSHITIFVIILTLNGFDSFHSACHVSSLFTHHRQPCHTRGKCRILAFIGSRAVYKCKGSPLNAKDLCNFQLKT